MTNLIEKPGSNQTQAPKIETKAGALAKALRAAKLGANTAAQLRFENGVFVRSSSDNGYASVRIEDGAWSGEPVVYRIDLPCAVGMIESIAPTEAISVSFENGEAFVVYGNGSRRFEAVRVDDSLPWQDRPADADVHEFDAKTIGLIRSHVYPAMSDDARRQILRGIYFDAIQGVLVATDTHRLAVMPHDFKGQKEGFLLPRQIASFLVGSDAGKVFGYRGRAWLEVRGDGYFATYSDSVAGVFPNWKRVLPAETTREVVVQTKAFLQAVRAVSYVAKSCAGRTFLTFQPNLLTEADSSELALEVSARAERVGAATELCPTISTKNCGGVKFAAQNRYLVAALATCGETATIRMSEAGKAFVIHCEDPDRFTVVMPMALA